MLISSSNRLLNRNDASELKKLIYLLLLFGLVSKRCSGNLVENYCAAPLACCYGPEDCNDDCDFQFAYEIDNNSERSKNSILMQLTAKPKIKAEIDFYAVCFVNQNDYLKENYEHASCINIYYSANFTRKIYVETILNGIKTADKVHLLADGIRVCESDQYFQVSWLIKLKFTWNNSEVNFFRNYYNMIVKSGRGMLDKRNRNISSLNVQDTHCERILKYKGGNVIVSVDFYKLLLYFLFASYINLWTRIL